MTDHNDIKNAMKNQPEKIPVEKAPRTLPQMWARRDKLKSVIEEAQKELAEINETLKKALE